VGLQVGSARDEVARVLVTLDITGAVVAEAVAGEADLIISHHPLIFEPLSSVLTDDVTGALVARLLAGGISLYVAHTNLDAAPEIGTAAALAGVLDLGDPGPLLEQDGLAWGRLGRLAEPMSLEDFASEVSERLAPARQTLIGDAGREVRVVAVMPGSGGDAVRPAAAAGADVLVCGDLKHHDALDALALGLAVLDAGHYATERPVVDSVVGYLQRQCPDLAVAPSQAVTDPFAASALER